MRRCNFKSVNTLTDCLVEFTGYFHQWGLEDSEFGSYTVAIVEDKQTKRVYTCLPNNIQFLE